MLYSASAAMGDEDDLDFYEEEEEEEEVLDEDDQEKDGDEDLRAGQNRVSACSSGVSGMDVDLNSVKTLLAGLPFAEDLLKLKPNLTAEQSQQIHTVFKKYYSLPSDAQKFAVSVIEALFWVSVEVRELLGGQRSRLVDTIHRVRKAFMSQHALKMYYCVFRCLKCLNTDTQTMANTVATKFHRALLARQIRWEQTQQIVLHRDVTQTEKQNDLRMVLPADLLSENSAGGKRKWQRKKRNTDSKPKQQKANKPQSTRQRKNKTDIKPFAEINCAQPTMQTGLPDLNFGLLSAFPLDLRLRGSIDFGNILDSSTPQYVRYIYPKVCAVVRL